MVATIFQDGAIKSVEVLTHDETVGIGNYAVETMPGRIVESQSVAVDTCIRLHPDLYRHQDGGAGGH